jgi:hypothetical protein
VRLRKELSKKGADAGAETIAAHLQIAGVDPVPAVSTIWRILSRRGFVTPQPQKRPRSSRKRFCAEQPNERWLADITHWGLARGAEVEILNILDDHSRLCLATDAWRITKGGDLVASFRTAFGRWGTPASVLTDNGAVFTAKQRGGASRAGGRARPARVQGQPFSALPSTNLRQGRTLPPNHEEMAGRATASCHRGWFATSTQPIRQLLQHRPTTPGAESADSAAGLPGPSQCGPHGPEVVV